jgi:hypothetical protein
VRLNVPRLNRPVWRGWTGVFGLVEPSPFEAALRSARRVDTAVDVDPIGEFGVV